MRSHLRAADDQLSVAAVGGDRLVEMQRIEIARRAEKAFESSGVIVSVSENRLTDMNPHCHLTLRSDGGRHVRRSAYRRC